MLVSTTAHGVLAVEPLLEVGRPVVDADWISSTREGALVFRVSGGLRETLLSSLVRWSTPVENLRRAEAILADGSRLVLADSWGGRPAVSLVDDTVTLSTNLLDNVELSPNAFRAALFKAPFDTFGKTELRDQLLSGAASKDQVWLTNGDKLAGAISKIHTPSPATGAAVVFSLPDETESVELPIAQVAAVRRKVRDHDIDLGSLIVGLADGSRLVARQLHTKNKRFTAHLICGISLSGSTDDVVHLRAIGSRTEYLSNLKVLDYRHEPYLDIVWPYRLNRCVLGGPLTVGGRIYDQGIGVTSAARLTYKVPPDRKRFVASVAIDDVAKHRGSVVFRVYLLQNDWQLAFTSPVMRGGDPPIALSLELADANEIALVTDYADRGDELDYANWLDARFE